MWGIAEVERRAEVRVVRRWVGRGDGGEGGMRMRSWGVDMVCRWVEGCEGEVVMVGVEGGGGLAGRVDWSGYGRLDMFGVMISCFW